MIGHVLESRRVIWLGFDYHLKPLSSHLLCELGCFFGCLSAPRCCPVLSATLYRHDNHTLYVRRTAADFLPVGLKLGLCSIALSNRSCALAFANVVCLALVPFGVLTRYWPLLVLVTETGIFGYIKRKNRLIHSLSIDMLARAWYIFNINIPRPVASTANYVHLSCVAPAETRRGWRYYNNFSREQAPLACQGPYPHLPYDYHMGAPIRRIDRCFLYLDRRLGRSLWPTVPPFHRERF